MQSSGMRLFSMGIAAENKALDSVELQCWPCELLPMLDGELAPNAQTLQSEGIDGAGNMYTSQVQSDTVVTASWLSLETNRITPPDVRRGEQVLIWQYGDSDKYYWTSMGRDDRLRRKETLIYAYSNIPDESQDHGSLNANNSYMFELSTHNKTITFYTNKNDQEPFAYVLQLDTENGNVIVTDDVGNYIQLDSINTCIELTNKDGTSLKLDKKNIYGTATDSMYFNAPNLVQWQCENFVIKAGTSIHMEAGEQIIAKAGSQIYYKAGTQITCDTPVTACTNLLTAAGLSIGGGGLANSVEALGGYTCVVNTTMRVNQDAVFTGNVSIGGTLSADQVISTKDVIAPNAHKH